MGEALRNNDGEGFLNRRDGLVVTGPMETNVNDLHVFIVADSSDSSSYPQ